MPRTIGGEIQQSVAIISNGSRGGQGQGNNKTKGDFTFIDDFDLTVLVSMGGGLV
jgi:hypothetical protein